MKISFELCRGFSVIPVPGCAVASVVYSGGEWLLLTQVEQQAATGDVLQAACNRPAAGVWQGMDHLFCAAILSAHGMCLL